MRFMVLMIPGVYKGNKELKNFAPKAEDMQKMMKFNQTLLDKGAIIGLDGLHPLSEGARISYAGGKATVTDGPFVEAKEVLGGFWLLKANSKAEVIEWMKQCPAEPEDTIEIRPIFEPEDFGIQIDPATRKGTRP